MNAITQMTSTQPPEPRSRKVDSIARRLTSALEEIPGTRQLAISASSAPTAEDRAALFDRERALVASLAPADPKRVEVAISALRGAFTAAPDEVSASFAAALYARALQGFPLWAINEACGRFLEGRAVIPWKPAFCPTPPEMAAECRAILAPVFEERGIILKVLGAAVQSDPDPVMAERAQLAVLGAVRRWNETIRPEIQNKANVEEIQRQAEETLGEYAREIGRSAAIGPELAKKLAVMKADPA